MILSAVPAVMIVFELPIYHFVDDVIHHDERDDRTTHLRIKRIMISIMFVDEYFDELSPRLDDAETMSIEDARAMTLAAVREVYAQLYYSYKDK
jgi:hypothetical protein